MRRRPPRHHVRRFAAASLGFQGIPAQLAVPALVGALNDTNSEVRFWAAGALKTIDPEVASKVGADTATLPAVLKWLQHPDPSIRRAAVETLAKLGKLAQPAVPAVLAALGDRDPDVREEAGKALKAIDLEAAAKAGVK